MTTMDATVAEYRDLPLSLLFESTTNPRRHFDEAFLKELAENICANGILSHLLVRPKELALRDRLWRPALSLRTDRPVRHGAGAHPGNDRCSGIGGAVGRKFTAARRSPNGRGAGLQALLDSEDPKYSIEQTAETGESAAYVTASCA
jgi:ParB family chromosome partitioning protein